MADKRGFYITAPSNSSMEVFPDNTISSFKVQLPKSISLGEWRVALTQIQYPYSHPNVFDAHMNVKLPNNDDQTVRLFDGRYETIPDLIDVMQKQLANLRVADTILIFWDKIRTKTIISIRTEGYQFSISPQLARILGFGHSAKDTTFTKGHTTGEYFTDIDEGMTSIYVYSDAVQNQVVGNKLAPLLRVVPIRGRRKEENRCEEFQHLHYLPTKKETTSVLEFLLRRDDGSAIPFRKGKAILTLHFLPL